MSDIVTRLWGNTGKYPGFENLNTEAATEIERLRARVAELEAANDKWRVRCDAVTGRLQECAVDRNRLLDACKEANEWLVAMTLKAAFNKDDKTVSDEAASIVREVSGHISDAIAKSARAANGEVRSE